MGYLCFYLAVVAACLLWSAVFTAAARTRVGWIRRMLVAVAIAVPALSLLPWIYATAMMAF